MLAEEHGTGRRRVRTLSGALLSAHDQVHGGQLKHPAFAWFDAVGVLRDVPLAFHPPIMPRAIANRTGAEPDDARRNPLLRPHDYDSIAFHVESKTGNVCDGLERL